MKNILFCPTCRLGKVVVDDKLLCNNCNAEFDFSYNGLPILISDNELFNNTNTSRYKLSEKISKLGYPYGYDVIEQRLVHTLDEGIIDSAKSIRAILWNAITIICTLILSE